MTKSDALLKALANAVTAGGGIHSTAELACMLGVPCDPAFRNFLKDCVRQGRLRRLVRGFYESVVTPPTPETAIYQLITKLRSHVLSYISLESQLSHIGEISQVLMGRVTVMTKGRSGCFAHPMASLSSPIQSSQSNRSPSTYTTTRRFGCTGPTKHLQSLT